MAALTLSLRTAVIVGLSPDKLWNAGLFTLLSAFILSRLLLIARQPVPSFFIYPLLVLTLPSLNVHGILLTLIAAQNLSPPPAISRFSPPSMPGAPAPPSSGSFSPSDTSPKAATPASPPPSPGECAFPPDTTRLHPVALYAALAARILPSSSSANSDRQTQATHSPWPWPPPGTTQFLLDLLPPALPRLDHTILDPSSGSHSV